VYSTLYEYCTSKLAAGLLAAPAGVEVHAAELMQVPAMGTHPHASRPQVAVRVHDVHKGGGLRRQALGVKGGYGRQQGTIDKTRPRRVQTCRYKFYDEKCL
jgi:hypothetical protein